MTHVDASEVQATKADKKSGLPSFKLDKVQLELLSLLTSATASSKQLYKHTRTARTTPSEGTLPLYSGLPHATVCVQPVKLPRTHWAIRTRRLGLHLCFPSPHGNSGVLVPRQ